MENEKIMVTQSLMPSLEEYVEEIKPIFESKWLTNMGVKHNELEQKLKEYLKVNEISLFTNGHMALYSALKLMNLSGEVITTPFTFSSTTHAIVQNGLTPVFCDINNENYTIDVNKIESLITDKTSAIVPVHVYGQVCDVEKIEEIAKKYNLKVIYDAAHAFGVEFNGKGIGEYGDISMFSFHATKVFNTIEGGALVYKNHELKSMIDRFKNFGINGQERVEMIGINSKMNEFQASMGLCNLRHINEALERRRIIFERYTDLLSGIRGIKILHKQKGVKHNYAYYPVLFDKEIFGKSRDQVKEELQKENIYTRKYFYPLVTDYECYREKYNSSATPIAKEISNQVLTLPIYSDLDLEDVDKIVSIILKK